MGDLQLIQFELKLEPAEIPKLAGRYNSKEDEAASLLVPG
jgi:hypothetical protein